MQPSSTRSPSDRRLGLLIWLGLATSLIAPGTCRAHDVIAHAPVDLNIEEVREIFLGERQLAGSVRLNPVDNSSLQSEFLEKVLQTDMGKYHARWTRKAFREGLTAPPVKGSDAEVIAFVKATPGAIGYVSKAPAGVVVLQSF